MGICGRRSMASRTDWWTIFLLNTVRSSAPPIFQVFCLSVMIVPDFDLIGAVLLILGPVAFFIPSNILLMLPVSAACWMLPLRSDQYSFIQSLTSRCTLHCADLRAWSAVGDGLSLYACSAFRLDAMIGSSLAELESSSHSFGLPFFLPKAWSAVEYIVVLRLCHCSVEGAA